MLLPIKFYPEAVLRENLPLLDVSKDLEDVKKIAPIMEQVMLYMNGAGIAANQCGIKMRFAIINPAADDRYKDQEPFIIINPKLVKTDDPVHLDEGCLSCPINRTDQFKHEQFHIKRFNKITVEYYNSDGSLVTREVDGKLAQVFQHEIDHLNGVLYFDHLSQMKKEMIIKKIKKGVKLLYSGGVRYKKSNGKRRRIYG